MSELHVFRDTRNLVDHKVLNKRGEREREKQFGERMLMGARLIDEMLKVDRKIK